MSLELNPNCQTRLVEALADQLRDVRVKNGIFLDLRSMMRIADSEKIVPQNPKWKDTLSQYIGDEPLFSFVYETIGRDIYENRKYEQESESTPLSSLHRYADLNAIARHLVDEFNSLPWNNTFAN